MTRMGKMRITQEVAAAEIPATLGMMIPIVIPIVIPTATPKAAPHPLLHLLKGVEYSNHKKVVKRDNPVDFRLKRERTTKQPTKNHLFPDSPRGIRQDPKQKSQRFDIQ